MQVFLLMINVSHILNNSTPCGLYLKWGHVGFWSIMILESRSLKSKPTVWIKIFYCKRKKFIIILIYILIFKNKQFYNFIPSLCIFSHLHCPLFILPSHFPLHSLSSCVLSLSFLPIFHCHGHHHRPSWHTVAVPVEADC